MHCVSRETLQTSFYAYSSIKTKWHQIRKEIIIGIGIYVTTQGIKEYGKFERTYKDSGKT